MPAFDQIQPQTSAAAISFRFSSLPARATAVAGVSVLMALSAHVALPLPFTPVPLTLQTLVMMMAGLLLGPATAFAAMLLYLVEGACGLPVFSPAGPGGLAQLLGPTAGYLFSYPASSALAGLLFRTRGISRSAFARAFVAGLVAVALTLAAGAAWLSVVSHASLPAVLTAAVLPFLPGELLKLIAAAGVAGTVSRRN